MASSVPPKGRAPPVNSGKLVELPLDNAPTMKRYLDFLANTVANNSSSSSPLDPPPALPFISSQLPPLPSFHELQKLRQELELFEQTAKGRKEHVERNIQTLDRWTPSKSLSVDGDVPTKDEKVKDAKIAEPKRKEPVKERKSKADDTVREDSRVMLKLKIAPQVPRTEKAEEIPAHSSISNLSDPDKKRKRDDELVEPEPKRVYEGSPMPKSNSNRNNHTEQLVATPSKPPSHRPTVPKAKPRSSKKSGAQKNNKVKKRGSILGDKSAPVDDDDRMDDRPAIQVEGDFTKAKPSQNQIPIQTFWSFVDQFFRPLNEEDLKILETNGDEVTPYIVPPLGRSYKEQWSIEEAKLMSQLDAEISTATTYTAPAGQEYSEVNGAVHGGDVHMKPLSERIIASLVENRITSYMTPSSPLAPGDPDKIAFRTNWDMADLEQRMRNELRYIGLIDDDESFYNVEEEDEISHELRKLQTELRERYAINRTRKLQLKEVAQRWMAYQEYNGVLDDINKNIEQAYIKRFRTPTKSKGKKKIIKGEYRPMAENVMQHLENREKLIQEVGGFFPPDQFQLPQTSIYSG